MTWQDRALVIGARPHGEAGLVVELMTRGHGRHLGLVHGGRSRKLRPVLQPGNAVAAGWRARLEEQLGTLTVEPLAVRSAGLIASRLALAGVGTICVHLRLLAERDPHPALFDAADALADALAVAASGPGAVPASVPARLARFELLLLAELGFGLDLASCAATGGREDLAFVSPKSGRAVGRGAGEPYRDRLLPLPAFLLDAADEDPAPSCAAVADAFRLTGFFLDAYLYAPRNLTLPDDRARFAGLASGLV